MLLAELTVSPGSRQSAFPRQHQGKALSSTPRLKKPSLAPRQWKESGTRRGIQSPFWRSAWKAAEA